MQESVITELTASNEEYALETISIRFFSKEEDLKIPGGKILAHHVGNPVKHLFGILLAPFPAKVRKELIEIFQDDAQI